MNFVKMHGLGNDFVLINAMSEPNCSRNDWEAVAQKICDRHYGVGADGLILILPALEPGNDIRWRIINPDGSEPEMCGNGIRCFARYVYEQGIVSTASMRVETLAGIIVPEVQVQNGEIVGVCVDMGEPRLERQQIPMAGPAGGPVVGEAVEVNGQIVHVTAVSMGNPHCLIYVDDINSAPLTELGPLMEKHPLFPQKTNVEFVQVCSPDYVEMRVWERGAGPTLACGTGACATVVGSVLNGKTSRLATVNLAGGPLTIEWRESDNHVYMTGPAVEVFTGEWKE
ncbi:diaminopimelate epimerase [Heliophilum fasciatum]|uniref:Diaminopimelate epimerase n=1 Tax=Heliophilum fasciatum TaxID=35700 RepID=A0A4R2RXE8_9FIRM|nr:diaminopimelate epimerase [Heliophilum fasciatum]MCW2277217.1 diaminopimelate epimerase [Heliophilum fasciatum]TCP68148.1 diaminopimelate epimerase [Heliophilum fasciatum]